MTEPVELRKTLEADRAKIPPLGPAPDFVTLVQVPGRVKPVKVTFELSHRKNHRLFYTADCPRLDCDGGEITVETTLGNYGRTIWPPVRGIPQLCECCEDRLDNLWNAALDQARDQRRRQQ